MNEQQEQLETLREIRSLMERSARFNAINGLIGVIIGSVALIGIIVAYDFMGLSYTAPDYYLLATLANGQANTAFYTYLLSDALIVLIISIATSLLLSYRKAKNQNQHPWGVSAKNLLSSLTIPLIAGCIFCTALLYHQEIKFIAPATLIFYGFALLNASKHTVNDIRYLGLIQLSIGLVASFFTAYGLLFWALGFGLVHIGFGLYMYLKYDK